MGWCAITQALHFLDKVSEDTQHQHCLRASCDCSAGDSLRTKTSDTRRSARDTRCPGATSAAAALQHSAVISSVTRPGMPCWCCEYAGPDTTKQHRGRSSTCQEKTEDSSSGPSFAFVSQRDDATCTPRPSPGSVNRLCPTGDMALPLRLRRCLPSRQAGCVGRR